MCSLCNRLDKLQLLMGKDWDFFHLPFCFSWKHGCVYRYQILGCSWQVFNFSQLSGKAKCGGITFFFFFTICLLSFTLEKKPKVLHTIVITDRKVPQNPYHPSSPPFRHLAPTDGYELQGNEKQTKKLSW